MNYYDLVMLQGNINDVLFWKDNKETCFKILDSIKQNNVFRDYIIDKIKDFYFDTPIQDELIEIVITDIMSTNTSDIGRAWFYRFVTDFLKNRVEDDLEAIKNSDKKESKVFVTDGKLVKISGKKEMK